ncbi:MAG: glycosyltransferase family 2 protein, partial [Thermoanaerobaculia bacterium]|nr:glycosyltransferase family 2 protein [Thermoanaerobaculia bacterium]
MSVRAAAPAISLVIPFYDEEACVEEVCREALRALDSLGLDYELIAVDDGSRDATPARLTALATSTPRLRWLSWQPNRGQGAALYRGLHAARAPLVATMDGDGQNDPADLEVLLDRLRAAPAADLVVGIRADRHDSRLRRWMSRVANAVRGRVLRDRVHDSGCALRVFRREVVDALIPIRTLYSFIPALAVASGFRVAEVRVRHRGRAGGRSSYGLGVMLWRPLVDMLGVLWFTRR